MKKGNGFLLFVLLPIFGCQNLIPILPEEIPQTVSQFPSFDLEEYQVISDVIKSEYIGKNTKLVVIREEVYSKKYLFEYFDEDEKKEILDELTLDEKTYKEILQDFQKKEFALLSRNLDLNVNYLILTKDEEEKIFIDYAEVGWFLFYSRYPDAEGVIEVSRVGFNTQKNKALVYIGHVVKFLAGRGFHFLLIKENGVWKIAGAYNSWTS